MLLQLLNHQIDAKSKQRYQWVLLASVLVLFALVSGIYWQLDHRIQTIKKTIEKVRGAAITSPSLSMNQAILTLHQAVYEINTPWLSLLNQLEGQQSRNVTLMSLDTDIKQKHVRLVFEASSVDAMTEFIAQIAQFKCIQNTVLVDQQILPNSMAVHFTLEGQWGI